MFESLKQFARNLFDAVLPPLSEPIPEQPETESCDPKTIANHMRKTAAQLNLMAEKLDPLMSNLRTQFGEPPKLENWNTIMPAGRQIGKIKNVGTQEEINRLRRRKTEGKSQNTDLRNKLQSAFDKAEHQRGDKTIDLVKKALEELKELQFGNSIDPNPVDNTSQYKKAIKKVEYYPIGGIFNEDDID